MVLTRFLEMMKASAEKTTVKFMAEDELEQLLDKMSEGDPKARRLVIDLIMYFGRQGIIGQNMVALLAAFDSIGFRGQALIQAFEQNDYNFDETCYRGTFALIRSQFPFIKDPFVAPEAVAE